MTKGEWGVEKFMIFYDSGDLWLSMTQYMMLYINYLYNILLNAKVYDFFYCKYQILYLY